MDPAGRVTWGGGDISALPEFNRVSQLFTANGIRQTFKTSGFKFLPGLAGALERNLAEVEVSVDAGTPETYALVKGKDAFDRVTSNLREYAEAGEIHLKYIACKDNLGDRDIDGFVELARDLGTKYVIVTPEWKQCHDGALLQDEYLSAIARLIDSLGEIATVAPANRAEGERLFPDGMWAMIEPRLAVAAAPAAS